MAKKLKKNPYFGDFVEVQQLNDCACLTRLIIPNKKKIILDLL
jgi:hypothetical protein